ncbi:hypothetical protein GC105_04915 [Alkalibaculum sp. M08DMB]|uniref:Fimbrial assembly protein n=1 Tax=Alkalibaculum sporogenes TaxID=2655001 RepID=A0A6A7K6L2_9FIRM|nr:PilN domain-containing protein [Alkalibaculum sporogenes]MPW25129.1 hypothetical protein [Alkalibaculum sporogenes]
MRDINLLPEHMIKGNKSTEKTKFLYIVFVFILLLIISYLSIYVLDYINRRESYVLRQDIQGVEDILSAKTNIEKMEKEIQFKDEIILEIDKSSTNHYLLMQDIEKLVPVGIQFIEQVSEGGRMVINGIANDDREVADFAANLYKLNGITQIWIESAEYTDQIKFKVSFIYAVDGGVLSEVE